MRLRAFTTALAVSLLFMFGCETKDRPEPEPRPLVAEVVPEYREAGQAQIARIQTALGLAVSLPLPTPAQLDALSVSLPVDDIVLTTGLGSERPGNARVASMREFERAPMLIYRVNGFRDALSSQTWVSLNYEARTGEDFFARVHEVLTEEDPEGEARDTLVASLQEFVALKYLLIVREVAYQEPRRIDGETFSGGTFIGDMLVYDLSNEQLIGQLSLVTGSSGTASSISADMRINVKNRINEVLALAQQNVASHVPPPSTLSPLERDTQACQTGDMQACARAGDALWETDRAAALAPYRTACMASNGAACIRVGSLLMNDDDGVPANRAEAASFYDRACTAGTAAGCTVIGTFVRDGEDVPLDLARARQLYRQGCDGGSILGCTELGLMLVTDRGGPTDFTGGRIALTAGCDGENYNACTILGMIHQFGMEVDIDLNAARDLFQRACDNGIQDACERLAGLGTP